MLMDMQPSGEGRLPDHGRVACTACFGGEAVVFDASRTGSTVNQHPKLGSPAFPVLLGRRSGSG